MDNNINKYGKVSSSRPMNAAGWGFYILSRGLIIVFLGGLLLLYLGLTYWRYYDQKENDEDLASRKFAKELWHEKFTKAYYAYDLVDNYLKPGMSMAQVEELLGEPDFLRIYATPEGEIRCYDYMLGMLGNFHEDFELLVCYQNQSILKETLIVSGSRKYKPKWKLKETLWIRELKQQKGDDYDYR